MCVGKRGLLRYSTLGEGIGKFVYPTGFSHYFFSWYFRNYGLSLFVCKRAMWYNAKFHEWVLTYYSRVFYRIFYLAKAVAEQRIICN